MMRFACANRVALFDSSMLSPIDLKSSAPPHGKRVSGSVTWTCGTVGHINATMNDAVNGTFKKLIPH
jgi:hypothetical protein